MFYIKKLIETCLDPLSIIVVLLLVGLILTYFRRYHWGRRLILIAFIILLIVSLPWIPNRLFKPLQDQYAPLEQAPKTVEYIVVLGGGILPISNIPSNNLLKAGSMQRTIEAIRLWHQIPSAKILFSGADYYKKFNDGDYMAKTADMLDIPTSAVVTENHALDTAKEAAAIKNIIHNQPFILVTSAYHMPRAMTLFEQQGMRPIAAPCDFQVVEATHVREMFPSLYNMGKFDAALHEYQGMAWEKVRKIP